MTPGEIATIADTIGFDNSDHIVIDRPCFERLVALVAEKATTKEREACARTVLTIANEDAGNPYKQALRLGAEAIRARGAK